MKPVLLTVMFVILLLLSSAFIVVNAVGFLPIIIAEMVTVVTVQWLKGFKTAKSVTGMIRTALNILTPTHAGCAWRAGVIAVPVKSLALCPHPIHTYLKELRYWNPDRMVILTMVLTAATVVIIKILFDLYFSEIYCSSAFRGVYALASGYL